jgi:16S rRNA G966 N2-methylase RsmD
VLVDDDAACERLILRNGATLGMTSAIQVLRIDVFAALDELAARSRSFDLVLADPPYGDPVDDLLGAIDRSRLLAPGGLLVLEHAAKRQVMLPESSGLNLLQSRAYGDTKVTLINRESRS